MQSRFLPAAAALLLLAACAPAYNDDVDDDGVAVSSYSSEDAMMSEDEEEQYFSAELDGDQEVPAVDTEATGSGSFELMEDGLHYTIEVEGLSGPVTAAHFHAGEEGVAGDVVQPITFTNDRAEGVWALSDEQREDLEDGMFYVNVHTAEYPNGEIRGQVEEE